MKGARPIPVPQANQDHLYREAADRFGAALERVARAYEADPKKRRDLTQEIHFREQRRLQHELDELTAIENENPVS